MIWISFNKKMKKIKPIKVTSNDWLINCIPGPMTKFVGGFKDKIVSLFSTNIHKPNVYGGGKKLSKPNTQNKIDSIINPFILKKKKKENIDKIIRDIRRLSETEKLKKNERRKSEEKKEINDRLIKDGFIRDIKTLFEQGDCYFKLKRINILE